MSMLDNAVSSIRLGLEDFKAVSTDETRALSAIRNLTAGLLLMFKVKLQELSPPESKEALLKQNVMPALDMAGKPIWIGKGGKTVDVESIITRLDGLGVKGIDWKLLRKLTEMRNDVEHYYTRLPTSGLLEAMAASFHLIQQFVPTYLNRTPVQLLGENVWAYLTAQEAFYKREHEICQKANKAVSWTHPLLAISATLLQCPACRSELIKPRVPVAAPPETSFECTCCGTVAKYEEAAEVILTMHHYADLYYAATKGGEPPISTCTRCTHYTYLTEEAFCVLCLDNSPSPACLECGRELDQGEIDENDDLTKLCGHCRYTMEMD